MVIYYPHAIGCELYGFTELGSTSRRAMSLQIRDRAWVAHRHRLGDALGTQVTTPPCAWRATPLHRRSFIGTPKRERFTVFTACWRPPHGGKTSRLGQPYCICCTISMVSVFLLFRAEVGWLPRERGVAESARASSLSASHPHFCVRKAGSTTGRTGSTCQPAPLRPPLHFMPVVGSVEKLCS